MAFTGSTEVGKLIVQAAAGNLKKVTLELGGKSPNIVFADADLETAIRARRTRSSSTTASAAAPARGCSSRGSPTTRCVEGVAEQAKKIKVGPGLDPQTEMGPLVSQEQFDRVCGYLESGREEGAKAVAGGKGIDGKGYFVEPTVFTETDPSMQIQSRRSSARSSR